MPVSGTVTASGGATSANQTNGTQKTQVVDGSGNVQPAGDGVTQPIYQSRVGASSFQLLTGLTAGTTLLSGAGTLRKICVFYPVVVAALAASTSTTTPRRRARQS